MKKLFTLAVIATMAFAALAETGATYVGSYSGTHTQTLEGVSTEYAYTLNYAFTYNADKTLTISGEYVWTDGTPIGGESFQYVQIWGGDPAFVETQVTTLPVTDFVTSTQLFEDGEAVRVRFKWPVAAGQVDPEINYTVGSTNPTDVEEPETPETPEEPEEPATGEAVSYTGELPGVYTQTMNEVATDYSYVLNYTITYNADKTLTISGGYTWPNGSPVGAENFEYVQIWGGDPNFSETYVNTLPVTDLVTTQVFEEGETVRIAFKLPVALGAVEPQITYIVGSSNVTDGVEAIATEATPAVYYNLQGVRIANPERGIFIRVQNGKSVKVAL